MTSPVDRTTHLLSSIMSSNNQAANPSAPSLGSMETHSASKISKRQLHHNSVQIPGRNPMFESWENSAARNSAGFEYVRTNSAHGASITAATSLEPFGETGGATASAPFSGESSPSVSLPGTVVGQAHHQCGYGQ